MTLHSNGFDRIHTATGPEAITSLVALLLLVACASPVTAKAEPDGEVWDVTQPRGKARKIDFTTSEGTIQSLDASPDQRWIVFDLLAQIYRVPVGGGEAECLTQDSGIAINYDPRYAPDGKSIAFISDRGGTASLWIMDADGDEARLLLDGGDKSWIGQPAWSPDGTSIFVTRYYIRTHTPQTWVVPTQIWEVPVEGGDAKRLIGGPMSFVNRPSTSSGGRYLYYERMDPPENVDGYYQVGDRHHVRRLDRLTGIDEAVTEQHARRAYWDTPFFAGAPEISPDGNTLAFVRQVPFESRAYEGEEYARATGLWLRDLEAGSERLLLSPINPDLMDTKNGYHLRFANGYDWSDDQEDIFLPEGGKIRRVNVATGAVTTVPFTAHVRRTISERTTPDYSRSASAYRARYLQRPVSSSDGRTILFDAAGRIWKAGWPDGAPQPLVDTGDAFQHGAAWSPDGEWIAFATWDDTDGGHVWKVRAAGGEPMRITNRKGEYLNPVFSRDGEAIYAVDGVGAMFRGLGMQDNEQYRLVRIPSDGGEVREIIRLPAMVRPRVRDDGRIHFVQPISPYDWPGAASGVSEYEPRMALVTMRADGSDREQIATFPFSRDAALSPDGSMVAYQEGGNVLLGGLAAGGADVPFFNRTDMGENLQWLSRNGGMDPYWFAPEQLEFVSGNTYFRYDRGADELERRELPLDLPRRAPPGKLAFVNARVLTMKDRKVLEGATVIVEQGRIACVGRCESRTADRVIDADGKTVIPGLIDAHAHLSGDTGIQRQRNPEIGVYLAYGVTTVFEPAAHPAEVFPAADLCGAGRMVCPRILTTGPPLFPDLDMKKIRNPEDAQEEARRLHDWGAESLKQYAQPRRDVRQWIVEAARDQGLGVTSERMNLYYDLSKIMDGQSGWEHIISEYPVSSDVVNFIVRSGANYTPSLQATGQGLYPSEYWRSRMDMENDPKLRRFIPWRKLGRFRNAARRPMSEYPVVFWMETVKGIVRAGGSVSAGAHSREDGIGLHWEVWTFATKLTPMEALETATVNPSRYLGFGDDLGTIEAGKLADFVVLNGNPLDDVRNTANIAYVVKNGVVYDDDTLDEVWPETRPYGPRSWMLEGNDAARH